MNTDLEKKFQLFRNSITKVLTGVGFEENLIRLRTICRDSPNFLRDYSSDLIFSLNGELSQLLTYAVISNYCEEFTSLVKLDLLEIVRKKLFIPQYRDETFASIGSCKGKISSFTIYQLCLLTLDFDHGEELLFYFLEQNQELKRWFYGSIFNLHTVAKVKFTFKRIDRTPAKQPQRKRGYDDKGSARDQTSILPKLGRLGTEYQNQMDDFSSHVSELLLQQKYDCLIGLGYFSEATKLESLLDRKVIKTWKIKRK